MHTSKVKMDQNHSVLGWAKQEETPQARWHHFKSTLKIVHPCAIVHRGLMDWVNPKSPFQLMSIRDRAVAKDP